MTQQVLAPAVGRPYIGPKAQAHVPAEIATEVKEQAALRKCPQSEVWREIIELGWEAWRSGDQA